MFIHAWEVMGLSPATATGTRIENGEKTQLFLENRGAGLQIFSDKGLILS
jgi:hypothetical protein